MIDALLYAVRDGIRAAGMNYGPSQCDITDDGRPPERAGNVFVAVHDGKADSKADNQLFELYSFSVTITMRLGNVSLDRAGDQLIARNLELLPLGQRQGLNHKIEQLRAYLHMNWQITVLTSQTPNSANDNLSDWGTGTVYGFCEPMRFKSYTKPVLVGGEWFGSDPENEDFGVKSQLTFHGAKRFQPITAAQGSFL